MATGAFAYKVTQQTGRALARVGLSSVPKYSRSNKVHAHDISNQPFSGIYRTHGQSEHLGEDQAFRDGCDGGVKHPVPEVRTCHQIQGNQDLDTKLETT